MIILNMMSQKLPTIYDVARLAGVSLATVSRVINNNGSVKEKTKERVNEAIKELNYYPNAVAKGLATSNTTTIGLLLPELIDLYYSELAQGIDAVAKMYSYSVIFSVTDNSEGTEVDAFNALMEKHVDGIIFMGSTPNEELLKQLHNTNIPVVFAGSVDPEGTLPSVNIDYVEAVKQATEMLAKTVSDKNIALVDLPGTFPIKEMRKKSFQSILPNSKIFEVEDDYQAGYELGAEIKENGIEAVIVGEDEPAVGILNYMQDQNMNVPEDFQVITSNDTKLTRIARPSMTSVSQPKFDIGAVAMRLLTKLLANEDIEEKQVILPHDFDVRNTSK